MRNSASFEAGLNDDVWPRDSACLRDPFDGAGAGGVTHKQPCNKMEMDVKTKNRIEEADTLLANALVSLDSDKILRGICEVRKAQEILNKLLKEYRQEQAQRRQAKCEAGD